MLRRLAWSSTPAGSFGRADLDVIVALSRRNNERHHVSGMLLYTGTHFLGVLEGTEWDLDTLWRNLSRDDRHVGLQRIGDELCGARWFPVWMAACINHPTVGAQIEMLRSPRRSNAAPWAQTIRPIMQCADSL